MNRFNFHLVLLFLLTFTDSFLGLDTYVSMKTQIILAVYLIEMIHNKELHEKK